MWGSKKNPGGIDFDAAAARVTAEPEPGSDEEVNRNAEFVADAIESEESEKLEIRPEWAVLMARAPYAVVARFYHPAFALTDEQAEKLGPKMLPLIRKVTDVWIPSWLAGVSNRNPEVFDAVAALAVTGFIQWQHVQKIQQAETEAAENAKRVKGERVTEMPIRSEPGVEVKDETVAERVHRIVGERTADGSLVI
jgi:hypothetical protein